MIFTSPHATRAPYPKTTLTELTAATVARLPDKPAFIEPDGRTTTFRQFWDAVRGLARWLQDQGLQKGDRIAIYSPNATEYAAVAHATFMAGGTMTPLNPLYKEREVEHQINDSGAVRFFVHPALAATVEAAKPSLPPSLTINETTSVWDLAREGAAKGAPLPVDLDPERDLAALPYSSGTTGLPKGVMLSHFNLASNVRQLAPLDLIREQSVLLDFLPFYHIYGMQVLMNSGLVMGATQVIVPRFDPELVVSLIEKHRVTDFFVVPPALLFLTHFPGAEGRDLSSLRYFFSGAAPLPLEVARQAEKRFGRPVLQGYGMTETSPVTNCIVVGRQREGTVGPPIPDTLERVVDLDTGKDLGPDEVGELWVKGPQVMLGYWNRPDATAETITPDGWLRTGDVVSIDADGYVTIRDRLKEMIKYKGYQIAPAELEAVIVEHPGVLDAAVIPREDLESGEVPKAFVVLKPGQQVSADELMEFVAGRVAPYKKVRLVEFVDAIPKNPSGKILRRQLIEQERERAREAGVPGEFAGER